MSSECEIFQQEKVSKKKEVKEVEEEEEDENDGEIIQECTICFAPLNSTGEHRISSLKCGHIFGKCCIKEWLSRKQHGANQSKCPICGENASVKDIYPIYSKYTFIDKEGLEREMENSKIVKKRKLDTQKQYNDLVEVYNGLLQKVNDSKLEIQSYESQLSKLRWNPQQQNYSMKKFALVSSWKLSNKPNVSKIFTYDNKNNIIYVTKSQNLYEHGILGINLETYSATSYSPLHKKLIKDCKYNTVNDLLLTASMDRTVKLYSVNDKDNILSVNVVSPCWSCCWSKKNENHFFIGLGNNKINAYDLRKLNRPLDIISNSKQMGLGKPIHSLVYISKEESKSFNSLEECYDGVLGASLDKVFFCTPQQQTASLVDNTPSDTLSTNNANATTTKVTISSNAPTSMSSTSISSTAINKKDSGPTLTDHHFPASAPIASTSFPSSSKENTLLPGENENENKNESNSLVKMDSIYSAMKFTTTACSSSISNNNNNSYESSSGKLYNFFNWNENHGLITSLSYDVHSNQCIVTSRKSTPIVNKFATVYTIGYLDFNPDTLFKKRHAIIARNEQKLMTKAALYTEANTENCYAVVSDEYAKSICVWSIGWNEENSLGVHSLSQEILTYDNSPILDIDICTIKDSTNYLCALNENKLFVHQSS
ncbi:hypothetical protein LY90DRAFT_706203 [Neocallimastix californiae]|jgi:hypothetical protein|uniref:RING-type E3 ubiquitin transferase n=1 Tax=Neocallimastix californiae TaxID=1754190 RepID=A0A1Y2AUP5_9FUNG|nr:hypothetical protein LY90DRAFT_706203 [Neocallimastix californiae]|eukprot:ORY26000.1 hypothetical protein LY90DRAFT_706203 [Neocallimastix californiae]